MCGFNTDGLVDFAAAVVVIVVTRAAAVAIAPNAGRVDAGGFLGWT